MRLKGQVVLHQVVRLLLTLDGLLLVVKERSRGEGGGVPAADWPVLPLSLDRSARGRGYDPLLTRLQQQRLNSPSLPPSESIRSSTPSCNPRSGERLGRVLLSNVLGGEDDRGRAGEVGRDGCCCLGC